MIEVEVPGQGVVEFPDDTSEDAITGALQRFSQPQIKLSPYEQARMAGPLPPMGTMGPEHPQEVLELPKLAQIPGEILNQITQPAGDILADVLNRTGLDPSAQPGQPVGGTSGPIGLFNIPGLGTGPMKWIAPEFARGAEQKAGELFNEFRTPEMLGTLPLAPESKLIQGLFAGQAVAQIPESLQAVAQARSPQELGGALTGAGANIGMAYLMGKGFAKERIPNARKNFPPAEIHGDVQPQPEQSPGQVPAQEGSGGVQPQAQTVAQTAQVPLDLVADLEREAIDAGEKEGSPVKVVDSFTGEDPNAPFAGRFMRATGKGIEVKRGEFQDWIQDLVSRGIPPDQIRLAVQARINEEQIHNQTISAVGSEGAESYWNNLSAAEKLIQQRRYTGQWTRTGYYAGWSDVQMGHEAIRHRMQQLMNRTPSEIAEVAGREYWTLKSLTALEDVIRKTREALGTDASKAQLAILAKVQGNLGVAQAVIGGPAAVRRKAKGQPYDPEQMKMFGVEQMTAKGVPGSTETVQPISAQEAGALPSFTANDVDVAAVKELSKPVPSFNRFLGWVERNVGSGVRPDRQSLWQDQMWNYLLNAPGERLEQMRSALGLEKDTGTARVGSREEVGKTKRGTGVLRRAPQEYRATVISAIAQKLMGEAMPRMRDLDRSEVALDDIDFENARADAGAYHKFSESEMTDPDKYTAILSNRARPSKHDPVSNTRRVAVLVDKRTGQVELVSAYKHGREGIEVTDPSGSTGVKNKPSRSIGGLLGRYRLHASILLRDPVRSFHQHFEKMSDYVSAIEKEAEDREKVAEFDTAEESMFERELMMSQLYPGEELEAPEGLRAEEQGAEEEIPVKERRSRAEEIRDLREAQEPPAVGEGVEGEGGIAVGPQAGVARGAMGIGKGMIERNRYSPLTATEANAVRDFVGPIDSLEDMKAAVQELIDTGKLALERPYRSTGTKTFRELKSELPRYRFRAIHRASISAIQKVAQDIFNRAHDILPGAQKQVHVTQEQAYEAALNSIYNAIIDAKSPQDFTQRLLGQHTRPTGEALTPAWRGQPLLARAEGVSRELTMRSRVPPTTVRGPSGRPIPATAPAPEPGLGGPGRVIPPEQLPEAARAHVEELAAEEKPYVPSGESFRPAKPTGRIRDYPVEFVTKTGLRGPRLEPREIPAAVRRNAKVFSGKYDTLRDKLAALVKRPATNHEIYALKDGAENQADIYSYNQSNGIRLASMAPPGPATRIKERETTAKQVRAAAKAVIAAQFEPAPGVKRINPKVFDDLEAKVTNGRGKAEAMIAHAERLLSARQATPTTRSNLKMGRAWLKAVDQLQAELDYARAHYKDPEMRAAVAAYNEVMEQHRQFLNNNGAQIAGRENFIPGRYEGEMWMDGRIGWGGNRILGNQFRMPKVFDNYYDAISVGPYLPVNPDIADLAQHSISRGARAVNNQMWLENLKSMRDRATGQLIAKSAVGVPVNIEVEDPATGQMVTEKSWQWKSPDPNYELVQFSRDAKPVAVRVGYSKVVGTAMAKSHIDEYPGAKAAKYASALLKHGIVLALDTFHPGRLAEYNMALGGGKWYEVTLPRYERGWSALTWEAKDLPQAVAKGLIPKEAADWALEPIKVHDRGRVLTMTRHQLLRDAVLRGFNTVRIADGLYRNAIEQVPLVGKAWNRALESANKWIFDKITPGMMAESFVRNFERLNKPGGLSYDRQMREVIRDVNIQYGNMGRQGLFKSPTVRDVLQIFMLAPMWREGLVQKEVRALSRFSGASALLGRRGMDANNYIGTLGRGLARGIGAWFVTAQIINMLSRGHPTWQNKEDGHALDAWIPAPNGKDGIWISTLGVFAEVLHDLVRLGESKPRVWDALEQMGVNTYGPVGRATRILTTGQTMTGERISSTAGILGAAAGELAPLPISATPFRSLAHAVAPGLVRPLKPGEAMQRMAALVGVKTQLATRSETDIRAKAAKFLRTEGLKVPSEYPVTTDEPSYSKLRQALRNDDSSGIKDTYAGLLKHHTPQQIEKSLKQFTSRPYTGSKANEELFLYSLSNDDLELYHKANLERTETFEKFMDWLRTQ